MRGRLSGWIAIIGAAIFCTGLLNNAWGAEWTLYASPLSGDKYYDKSSIRKNKNIVSVWEKIIYSEVEKRNALSSLKSLGVLVDNSNILSHEIAFHDIDCVNYKIRLSSKTVYDNKDNSVFSYPDTNFGWRNIVPGSMNEELKKIVCSVGKTSKKKRK